MKFFYPWLFMIFILMVCSCTQAQPAIISSQPSQQVIRYLDLSSLTINDLVEPTAAPLIQPSATPVVEKATVTPTLTVTSGQQALAQSPTPLASSTTPTPGCTNKAEFVQNLLISDNVELKPGKRFVKVWQVKNAGTCTWTSSYSLVYVGGESFKSPPSVPLLQEVRPGELANIQLNLVTPILDGTFIGQWMLQDGSGNLFGIGKLGDQPLTVQIIVQHKIRPKQY